LHKAGTGIALKEVAYRPTGGFAMPFFSSPRKHTPAVQKTSEIVMFNYRRPVRARQVALGSNGRLWLVEALDAVHGIWVWQDEYNGVDQALDEARRLSLMLS
jgi:hypothetical protein